MRHIIPCSTDAEGGTTSDAIAWMFVAYVWKLHGLPDNIVSDRGPQFISSVWKSIYKRLKIQMSLSTAYYPQSNR